METKASSLDKAVDLVENWIHEPEAFMDCLSQILERDALPPAGISPEILEQALNTLRYQDIAVWKGVYEITLPQGFKRLKIYPESAKVTIDEVEYSVTPPVQGEKEYTLLSADVGEWSLKFVDHLEDDGTVGLNTFSGTFKRKGEVTGVKAEGKQIIPPPEKKNPSAEEIIGYVLTAIGIPLTIFSYIQLCRCRADNATARQVDTIMQQQTHSFFTEAYQEVKDTVLLELENKKDGIIEEYESRLKAKAQALNSELLRDQNKDPHKKADLDAYESRRGTVIEEMEKSSADVMKQVIKEKIDSFYTEQFEAAQDGRFKMIEEQIHIKELVLKRFAEDWEESARDRMTDKFVKHYVEHIVHEQEVVSQRNCMTELERDINNVTHECSRFQAEYDRIQREIDLLVARANNPNIPDNEQKKAINDQAGKYKERIRVTEHKLDWERRASRLDFEKNRKQDFINKNVHKPTFWR